MLDEHRKNLDIRLLNQSAQTISISFKDNNPAKTSEIVNTIAEEFLKYNVEKKRESAQNVLKFIDEQLQKFMMELDETEKKLHTFKDNKLLLDDVSATSYYSLINDKMSNIEEEILNIEFELTTLENIKDQIINNENLNIYELIALLSGTKSEGILVNILNMIQGLLREKESLLNDVTANNHRIKVLDKQIRNQKQILSDFVDKTIERLEIKKNDYKTKLAEFENRIFDQSAIDELEYSRLKRIYAINEGFFNQLVEKKAHYMISEAGYVSENVILEKASIPKFHISPSKKITYSIALIICAIISFIIIFIRYLLHDKITSASDIKAYTDVPISGIIPEYKEKIPVSKLIVHRKPKSIISEAFRTTRSNLEFISHKEGAKIIAISSTVSGEGKTFITINLAGIIAVSGKKVLLIDLDLRKPKIHISFESENDKGMSTILIKKNSIEECIRDSKLKNLYYLTAGPTPPNPSELANSREMDMLLNSLKEKFDVIIIDTPPIGIVTDGVNIYRKADYPLYVLKTGFSKRTYLNSINDLNGNKGIKNLSIILNCIESASSKYGSGFGYGYGYGYGYDYYDDEETNKNKKFFLKNLFSKKLT